MTRLQIGAAAGIVVVLLGLVWLLPSRGAPGTEVRMFAVSAGDVRRVIVSPKFSGRRRHAPRRLEFAVGSGKVDAFLLPFEPTDPSEVSRMQELTEGLAEGIAPADPIDAVIAAPRGEIVLPQTLLATDYLLLLHVDSPGELTVRISYGAD